MSYTPRRVGGLISTRLGLTLDPVCLFVVAATHNLFNFIKRRTITSEAALVQIG